MCVQGTGCGTGFTAVPSPSLFLDIKQTFLLQRFYSQLGQDKWIVGRVFPGVEDGFFVDIGAGHAEMHSNSGASVINCCCSALISF